MADLSKKEDREKIKRTLIEKYPSLTDKDFNFDKDDELVIHLQQKLGKTKEEMRKIIRKI